MAFIASPLAISRRSHNSYNGVAVVSHSSSSSSSSSCLFRHRPTRARALTMTASSGSETKQPHAQSLAAAWPAFAARMKESEEIPGYDEWHALVDGLVRAGDDANAVVWVLNLMRETGRTPTAVTYEKALAVCSTHEDRVGAFHLVEHMYKDKVLLGDVELPDGMEETLRKILPPEAFE